MPKRIQKIYKVNIALLQDSMFTEVQTLAFVNDDGSFRIASNKASGSWNFVKKFQCKFTLKDLKKYEVKKLK